MRRLWIVLVLAAASGLARSDVRKTKVGYRDAAPSDAHSSADPTVYRVTGGVLSTRSFDILVTPDDEDEVGAFDASDGFDEIMLEQGSGLVIGWYPILHGIHSRVVAGTLGLPDDVDAQRIEIALNLDDRAATTTCLVVLDRRETEDVYYVLYVGTPQGAQETVVTISYTDDQNVTHEIDLRKRDEGTKVTVSNGAHTRSRLFYVYGSDDNPDIPETRCLDNILGEARHLGVWNPLEIPIAFVPD